jgi:hypothetical protein
MDVMVRTAAWVGRRGLRAKRRHAAWRALILDFFAGSGHASSLGSRVRSGLAAKRHQAAFRAATVYTCAPVRVHAALWAFVLDFAVDTLSDVPPDDSVVSGLPAKRRQAAFRAATVYTGAPLRVLKHCFPVIMFAGRPMMQWMRRTRVVITTFVLRVEVLSGCWKGLCHHGATRGTHNGKRT